MGASAIGQMNIVLSANAASFSAGIDQAQRQLDKLAGRARQAGHATVSSVQASSAAIRVLEGGMTGNIRAAERFIAIIPGLGRALQVAFPVVGAIALGGVLLKIGKDVADFIEKARAMPDKIGDGFNRLNLSARAANDELEKTNINLQNQILKLEGRPQNGIAEALIDARIAADKLAESLQSDADKMDELLSKNHISGLAGLVTGRAGTASTESSISAWNEAIRQLAYQRSDALHAGTPQGAQRAAELLQEIASKRQQAMAWADAALRQAQNVQSVVAARGTGAISVARNGDMSLALDQSGNIKALQGFRGSLQEQGDYQQEEAQNAQLAARAKSLQAAKDYASAQAEVARKTMAQWRAELEAQKAAQDTTLLQEAQFWGQRAALEKHGGAAVAAALTEADKVIAQMRAQNIRAAADTHGIYGAPRSAPQDLAAQDTGAMREQGRQAAQYLDNLNRGIDLQRQNASAVAEASIQMAVATGQMDKLSAAQALAALHTQEYRDAMDHLAGALQAVDEQRRSGALSDLQASQRSSELQDQGIQMQGQRALQGMQDTQLVLQQTVVGASREALDQMVAAWKDMAGQIAETFTRTVGSFNADVVTLMTSGGLRNGAVSDMFGRTFLQAGRGLANTALTKTESTVLGRFGFGGLGKRDGASPQTALWVTLAGTGPGGRAQGGTIGALAAIPGVSGGKTGTGIGGWLSALFGLGARAGASADAVTPQGPPAAASQVASQIGASAGNAVASAAAPSGGLLSGVLGAAGGLFQGFFAGGGDVVAHRPAMVGELGPELFIPRTPGRIVPNAHLGGTTHHNHIAIDARGASNPAQVEAAVHRAMGAYLPAAVSASVAAMHEQRLRRPPSAP